MYKIKRRALKLLTLFLFTIFLVHPSYGQDYLVELSLGNGLWGGPWYQAIQDTDSSLGLESKQLLIPAFAASINWQGPQLFGPVRFNAAAGLGLWSGSLAGVQGGELERAHSIMAFALEARPMLKAEFPIRGGSLVADLSLGTGIILGPIVAIDDLPGFRSVSKASPVFFKRFIGIAGLGLGYRSTGPLSYGLRGEAALADFDEASGSKPNWMGRFMVSIAYELPAKEIQ
jgi:hypothetical protein